MWAAAFDHAHYSTYQLALFMLNAYTLKSIPFLAILIGLWFKPAPTLKGRTAILAGIIGCFVALIICRLVQDFGPHRPRPVHIPAYGFPSDLGFTHDWSSFPSDTSGITFALATAIFIASRPLGLLAVAWGVLVPVGMKLLTGAHYPSDVIAGAVIGVLSAVAVYATLQRFRLPMAIVARSAGTHPSLFYAAAFVLSFQLATYFDDLRSFGTTAKRVVKNRSTEDLKASPGFITGAGV